MNQDAFELLRAANPLPEDPPPLPIAPLLERVDEVPSQSSQTPHRPLLADRARFRGHGPGGPGRRPKRRSGIRLASLALSAVVLLGAIATLAFTRSTTPSAPKALLGDALPPEHETATANQLTPDEFQDFKESSTGGPKEVPESGLP